MREFQGALFRAVFLCLCVLLYFLKILVVIFLICLAETNTQVCQHFVCLQNRRVSMPKAALPTGYSRLT